MTTIKAEAQFNPYILGDGKILNIAFKYETREVEIKLEIRKCISKNKFVPCVVSLHFYHVTKFDIVEDFATSGYYSDIVFVQIADHQVYASFDPFGNSGQPHENDNLIIEAGSWKIEEVLNLDTRT